MVSRSINKMLKFAYGLTIIVNGFLYLFAWCAVVFITILWSFTVLPKILVTKNYEKKEVVISDEFKPNMGKRFGYQLKGLFSEELGDHKILFPNKKYKIFYAKNKDIKKKFWIWHDQKKNRSFLAFDNEDKFSRLPHLRRLLPYYGMLIITFSILKIHKRLSANGFFK